jgi:hypothetical protein
VSCGTMKGNLSLLRSCPCTKWHLTFSVMHLRYWKYKKNEFTCDASWYLKLPVLRLKWPRQCMCGFMDFKYSHVWLKSVICEPNPESPFIRNIIHSLVRTSGMSFNKLSKFGYTWDGESVSYQNILNSMLDSHIYLQNPAWVFRGNVVSHMDCFSFGCKHELN